MNKQWKLGLVVIGAALGACSHKAEPSRHAVGTYINEGSMIFGANPCTVISDTAVFPPGETETEGTRFVFAPGNIVETCGDSKLATIALMPTAVKITGPAQLIVGADGVEYFDATLMAGDKTLEGNADLEWSLGPDCNQIAEFAPVMGSQDTGGPDRFRRLVARGAGTCTVIVTATTGSFLYEAFTPAQFRAAKRVVLK